jgi:hypothetical protein
VTAQSAAWTAPGQTAADVGSSAPPAAAPPDAPALPGTAFPLGASLRADGTNFAVAAPAAESVTLCLFDEAGAETRVPLMDRDAGVWHGFVPGVTAGQTYGYRVSAATIRAPDRASTRRNCCSTRTPGRHRCGDVRARGTRLRGR